MEKLIYVHLTRLGDSKECPLTDSTNDWYLIKQSEGGDGVEMTRVFEDASRPNHRSPALLDTNCKVIGSCIYAIGGISIKSGYPYFVSDEGSNAIHFIDTRNPKDGWRTCCTFPFIISDCQSAVVNDKWLYVFGGVRCNICAAPDYTWGYAINVDDSKQVRKINPPGNSPTFPIFATCVSPGTLVAYMAEESTWYKLDCKNSTWTVYQEDSPRLSKWLINCITAVDDGILYTYDIYHTQLISYDIRNKKELYLVDLPKSFWFPRQVVLKFIALSKNMFCIMWQQRGGVNELRICYTRFSVSGHLPKPTVDAEEMQIFPVVGNSLLNVVAVDPHSDEANSSSSNSNAVHE